MTSSQFSSSFSERIRLHGDPLANHDAMVVRGNARFTVLTSRLLRLEYSPTGTFEDRATFAFPNRAAPAPPFTASEEDGTLTIDTGALLLQYRPGTGPFSPDNLSITLTLNGEPIVWKPGTPATGNLRGTRRTLDEAVGPVALSEGIISRDGWALYDDSAGVVFKRGGTWVEPRSGGPQQDWYFFGYGHDYTAALSEYTRFGGPAPLIPRFVLGAWWSRYWDYSAEDLQQLVHDFAAHDLPLDVLVIDMDWHTPDSWTGYTWNRELFPDPEAFLRWAHERNLHITLNLHPAEGIQSFEEVYPRFARAMGIDPTTHEAVPFHPGDPNFVRHYFELLHHPMEEQGVDFWWLDWQQGEASDMPGLDPLIWLNHLHFLDSARTGQRPMLYSRWGGLGNHRYYIGFSGDTYAVWPALEFLPYFTATASNVLYGWWSHDIGGHFGADTPELYARWVQFGALSPCLRLHSSKDELAERRPWAFPSPVPEAARAAFHWRYAALPYLYTMARAASDTGIPLCRPLYYANPEQESAYAARDEYYLGDSMIAAPMVRPADPATGLASVDVWVPEGTWIDYETLETFTGPRWVRLFGDLMRMPRLVCEGAMIPLAPPTRTTAEVPTYNLILQVFPGPSGAFRLYEDDGTTPAYERGEYEWTPIAMRTTEDNVCQLTIGPVEGNCPGLPAARGYEIRLMGTRQPARVTVRGEETTDWRYDPLTLTTVVQVPINDKRSPISLTVEADGKISALNEAHNRQCIEADLRRLLGTSYPDAAWEDLPALVLALTPDHPGRADAIARLGGPFAAVRENLTLPEAAHSLGSVRIAASARPDPLECTVTWTAHTSEGIRSTAEHIAAVRQDRILQNPFTFSGRLQPLRWEAEIELKWRGATIRQHYRSSAICPSIPTYRIAIDGDERTFSQDPTALPALNQPHMVRLSTPYGEQLEARKPLTAHAVMTITCMDNREVRIAFNTPGKISLRLNGQVVAASPAPDDFVLPDMPSVREVHLSEPVRLHAGDNTLELTVTPKQEYGRWGMDFVAAVLDLDNTTATGLSYRSSEAPPST